ncbi:hypothetical protein [Methylocystis bryophila]|uniref:Uncharacterized protein n=1 Tax=Methylocystis bryophila TaxID=655015 RepID=A0A1W6MRA7_9HYPH|nr:hypothetical protein [Methylocystis bryophila]ARN80029.1 hypothetical protein B1812_01850 [Methylocystis bryophila]BDV39942.1 hypothetical protein DSM21852_31950 [Methylocystis bryophila]
MTKQLVMALGLTHKDSQPAAAGPPASLETLFASFEPKLPLSAIDLNKAACLFDSYEAAEQLISFAYKSTENAKDQTDFHLNIVVISCSASSNDGIMVARAIAMLDKIEQKQPSSEYPIDTYITPDIYDALDPRHQDLYRAATQVGKDLVHQRLQEDAQRCFIISPIGDAQSPVRERADYVFKTYVKPACEAASFRAVRADMMRGGEITPEMIDALQSDPIVLVYLGSPKLGWNPNVMYELGLRHDAPYIALKDMTADGKKYELPFDIQDKRVVEIPEVPGKDDDIAATVRTIKDRIKDAVIDKQWNYLYPNATIDLKLGDPAASKYIEGSPQIEAFFEMKRVKGKLLNDVIQHLTMKMPDYQRRPFMEEQNSLIGSLILSMGNVSDVEYPYATIPIVFEKHSKLAGRAFLPIIVRYQFSPATNVLRLRVVYLDVTTATTMDSAKHYFTCTLKCDKQLSLS